jgi:regulator of protease activity HflC (stomatin/prohibitin superfamily)
MKAAPGALILALTIMYILALILGAFALEQPSVGYLILLAVSVFVITLAFRGLFIVNPNDGKVFVLLGKYKGTVRDSGFFWANPFAARSSISLKANNLASSVIKVNDLLGNPIEIAAVVVWQVRDTAQALFDVEDFRQYVDVQIETAVRQLASAHPYDEDQAEDDLPSLRGDNEIVNATLQTQLQSRLDRAGIEVIEARLSHLAYAPEIASAMLQRQQATAIIAARQKIVEGAVLMVEQALRDLGRKSVVELDDERRATLVGNLLVVLCGQADAQPVINTGSLYN